MWSRVFILKLIFWKLWPYLFILTPHTGCFFGWSAQKMNKCHTLSKFWHLELFSLDLHVIWQKTPCIYANRQHLVAFTPLQATKTGSKQPCSQFPPKRRLVPYAYRSFDLLWTIFHCFRVTGPGVKKFQFWLIFFVRPQKKVSGSCTLNFDATDLPHS